MFQGRRGKRQGQQRAATGFRPGVEALEDRTLLSVGLIADINKTTQSAFPAEMSHISSVHAGAWTYFTATDGKQDNELWRTDGTGRNTFLVKVIGGPADATVGIDHLTALGNRVVFTADDGIHGNELWISDGTARGTQLLLDINKLKIDDVPSGSDARDFVSVGNRVFFTAVAEPQGRELWVTDGTKPGTYLVRDLDPFNTDPYADGPSNLTAFGNRVVFYARDDVDGRELWISDGTKQGTRIVRDINRGSDDGAPPAFAADVPMAVVGGMLYFGADNGLSGPELWKTDGTWRGTNIVRDIHPGQAADNGSLAVGSFPESFTSLDGTLYFTADDGKHGRALWKSDGTRLGTKIVASADIPGFADMQDPQRLTPFGHKLAFLSTMSSGDQALWVSNGTTAGTKMLKVVAPAGSPSLIYAAVVPWMPNRQDLLAADDTIYFTAIDTDHGRELWKTDGTTNGTSMVRDIRDGQAGSQIGFLNVHNHRVLFAANDGTTGRELWVSDGSLQGTQRVRDINRRPGDSNPSEPIQFGSNYYFSADDGIHGAELWKSDGTPGGTKLVKDINTSFTPDWSVGGDTEPGGSNIHDLVALNGLVYFVADDGIHGDELWVSDGSNGGTHMVQDINTSPPNYWSHGGLNAGASIDQLTVLGPKLYFTADDGEHGRELWISDGSDGGTHIVEDINTHEGGPWVIPLIESDQPDETANTRIAAPWLMSGNASSDPGELSVFGGKLYFVADDGDHGRELWTSDGTPVGTSMVADINPGNAATAGEPAPGSNPSSLTQFGAWLFFSADDGTHGTELWRTDGTTGGTRMVLDVNRATETSSDSGQSIPGSSFPSNLTVVGGILYFVANDGANGTELWKSDGTEKGTQLVRSLGTSLPDEPATVSEMTAVGNTLYFVSDAGGNGSELWTSDGTSKGTRMVTDLFPGSTLDPYSHTIMPNSSSPSNLVAYHGLLFFIAEDAAHGRELWSSDGTSMGTRLKADLMPGSHSGFGWESGLGVFGDTLIFGAGDALGGVEMRYFIEPLAA